MDYVKQLGALTLDHRFKRMMHRLLEEAETIYRALNLPIKPRWVSTLMLLHEHGPLTVMDIAERLSVTHPAVIQLGQDMIDAELIADARDEADGRRRLLALTPKAGALFPTLKRVWDELAKAQVAAFRVADCDILPVLDRVEARLDQTPIATVVLKRLTGVKGPSPEASGPDPASLDSSIPQGQRKVPR